MAAFDLGIQALSLLPCCSCCTTPPRYLASRLVSGHCRRSATAVRAVLPAVASPLSSILKELATRRTDCRIHIWYCGTLGLCEGSLLFKRDGPAAPYAISSRRRERRNITAASCAWLGRLAGHSADSAHFTILGWCIFGGTRCINRGHCCALASGAVHP